MGFPHTGLDNSKILGVGKHGNALLIKYLHYRKAISLTTSRHSFSIEIQFMDIIHFFALSTYELNTIATRYSTIVINFIEFFLQKDKLAKGLFFLAIIREISVFILLDMFVA